MDHPVVMVFSLSKNIVKDSNIYKKKVSWKVSIFRSHSVAQIGCSKFVCEKNQPLVLVTKIMFSMWEVAGSKLRCRSLWTLIQLGLTPNFTQK